MAFEYDVYSVAWGHGASTAGIVKELNKRGADGWQLVTTRRTTVHCEMRNCHDQK